MEEMSNNFTEVANITEQIKTLRVLFIREFPAANPDCSKFPPTLVPKRGCDYPGLFAEIIKVLADHLNASIEFHTIFDSDSNNNTDKLYIGQIVSLFMTALCQVYSDNDVRV